MAPTRELSTSVSRRNGNSEFVLADDKLLEDEDPHIFKQLRRVMRWVFLGHGGQRDWDNENSSKSRGSFSYRGNSIPMSKSKLSRSSHAGSENRKFVVINPGDRYYLMWEQIMLLLCMYSSCVAPFEFAFFRRLPSNLVWSDIAINFFFLADLILTFFVAYKDKKTFSYIEDHEKIAMRYLKTGFFIDLLNLVPWDLCYKAAGGDGGAEILRWFQFFRMYRAFRVDLFFDRLERDIRISYYAARIVRLLVVEFFCTHVAGCFFYYLATTVPSSDETDTWIGSLTLGGNSYENFRELNLGKRYVTSLYWAVVTMATVGYGDVHPVNPREMIFCMAFISFDMVLSAYLIGNITALIVKGSSTEKYRDKVTALIQYMNRNRLPRHLRHQMREHVRLQFETDQVGNEVLEDFPISIRHKVARTLYREVLKKCYLFASCSDDFIDQIVARGCPETFMPGEVIFQQRDTPDNMYILCEGLLVETEEGKDEEREIYMEDAVGEVAVLCNIPQPFTVFVKELTHVLRIEKQVFDVVIATYILDGRQVINSLLERAKQEDSKVASLANEINNRIAQQEAELTMTTINAASRGDIGHLTQLIQAGANPSKPDYDGRTALHLAASKGYDEVVKYLIREKADINACDHFGTTPLLEALRAGHDETARILEEKGGTVTLQEAGTELCNAVIRGNTELLRRLLQHGVDPNSADYDLRTPLHIAAAEGYLMMVQLLIHNGADVFAKDRWGNYPLTDAQECGSKAVLSVLEEAMVAKVGGTSTLNNVSSSQKTEGDPSTSTTLALAAAAIAKVDKEEKTVDSPKGKREIGEIGEVGEIRESGEMGKGVQKGKMSGLKMPSVESGMDLMNQSGSERNIMNSPRTGSSVGLLTPLRSGYGSPRGGYGRLPRSRGGGAGGMSFGLEASRKRVTLYPYHPWSRAKKAGRLVFIPPTLKELLNLGIQHFKEPYSRLLNGDGGEICAIEIVLDGDRLYLADDEDPEPDEATNLLG